MQFNQPSQQLKVIQCPNCGGNLEVKYFGQDRRGICPYCNTNVDLPNDIQIGQQQGQPVFIQFAYPQAIGQQQSSQGCTASVGLFALLFLLAVGGIGAFYALSSSESIKSGAESIIESVSGKNDDQFQIIEPHRQLEGPEHVLESVAYNPDNSLLLASGSDQLMVWDAQSGAVLANVEFSSSVDGPGFSSDGNEIYARDGSYINVYSTDGNLIRAIGDRYRFYALSPDTEWVAGVTYEKQIQIMSTQTGQVSLTIADIGDDYFGSFLFSPGNQYLVAGGTEKKLWVWNATTGDQIFSGTINAFTDKLMFQPNSSTLIVASNDALEYYLIENDVFSYQRIQNLEQDGPFSVDSIAISPDGQYIALGNFFGGILVWDIEESRAIYELTTDRGIRATAFSSDGQFVLGGSSDKTLYEWQLPAETN